MKRYKCNNIPKVKKKKKWVCIIPGSNAKSLDEKPNFRLISLIKHGSF